MKKISLLIATLMFLAITGPAQAVCPICTVAVAGGLGISRYLGIDDAITGVWIGGLVLSASLWLADVIRKKNWRVAHPDLTAIIVFYLFFFLILYLANFIGASNNTLWGVDKFIIGIIFGSVAFYVGMAIDQFLRKINDEQVYVYFQKVILPVLMLSLTSFGLFLITK